MSVPVDADPAVSADLAERNAALERYVFDLDALREIGIAISSTLDPAEVLRIACERARTLFEADCVAVALSRPHGRGSECGGTGAAELLDHFTTRFSPALARGETVLRESLPPGGTVQCAIAVPLRHGITTDGALLLGWHTSRRFPSETIRLAETLAVQVAIALQNARLIEEMRSVAARRDRFFSAMSHDLRTPITAIVGYSELLLDGIAGELSRRQHEMVDRICHVSDQLSQLVGDILDLTRLDAGRVEFHHEAVPLGVLIEEAVMTIEPQAHAKSLALRCELNGVSDSCLHADRFRVRQVLVNLLSNAVKFTSAGEIRVSAGCGQGRTWISVVDTGPGLPPGTEESIFEEFVQLACGGTRGEPGSGLGLAISRRLARAMGGDLTVQSSVGRGATFTLHLPSVG